MSRYNQELGSLWSNGKIFEHSVRSQFVNLERVKILAELEKMNNNVRSQLDATKLFAIGKEYVHANDPIKAERYFNDTLEKAEGLLLEVSARVALAETLSVPSQVFDKDKSRRLIQESFAILHDRKEGLARGLKLEVYDYAIKIEARLGNCEYSRELIDELVEIIIVQSRSIPNVNFDVETYKKTYDTLAPCIE